MEKAIELFPTQKAEKFINKFDDSTVAKSVNEDELFEYLGQAFDLSIKESNIREALIENRHYESASSLHRQF